jgi:hypothetical protein
MASPSKSGETQRRLEMRALAVLAIVLMLAGCGSSRRAKEVEPQGFLGDYSMLTPGAEGQAVLRHVNTGADWAKYDKVLVDPVVVLRSPGAEDIPERTSRPPPTSCTRSCARSSARTFSWSTPPARTRSGSRRR